jgi:hypothetical protein
LDRQLTVCRDAFGCWCSEQSGNKGREGGRADEEKLRRASWCSRGGAASRGASAGIDARNSRFRLVVAVGEVCRVDRSIGQLCARIVVRCDLSID